MSKHLLDSLLNYYIWRLVIFNLNCTCNFLFAEISKPTAVQAACILPIIRGRNCIAQAPTGSGKTMAFAIPMVQRWSKDPHGVYGLVLTPTRELAHQIKDQFNFLGGTSCKVCIVTGGADFQKQALELTNRPHFVVATPGRLVHERNHGVF